MAYGSDVIQRSTEWYVTTFYQKRPPGSRPIMHVYGPYPKAEAQREKRRMLADNHPAAGSSFHVRCARAVR